MENDVLLSSMKGQRSLAAIVFTDGVNFTARMSENEEHALSLIRRDLALMSDLCQRHEGRVLKYTGDGLLMYFISAVKAVACAMEIQQQIAEAAALLPHTDIMVHRIGIHLGDVFISETDVMGTGVNIAARLQTEAEPGGICVSQTVYDVVKTAMTFKSVYLGPRELKNIKEVVPVYRILPASQEEMTQFGAPTDADPTVLEVGRSTQDLTYFNPIPDPASEVARELGRYTPQLSRIKKLILCACRNRWETDPIALERINLRELVPELHRLAPTSRHLKAYLDNIVHSLSKQTEYAAVSDIILRSFDSLYPQQVSPSRDRYSDVVQELEQDRDLRRIKKLMLCVCQDVWESDPDRLDALNLQDLLRNLLELSPTLQHLTFSLDAVVKTLNKQAEYTRLAQRILDRVSPLYPGNQGVESTLISPFSHPSSDITAIETQIVTPQSAISSIPLAPQPVPPPLRLEPIGREPLPALSVPEPLARPESLGSKPQNAQLPNPELVQSESQPELKEIPDLFDVRLEICKYANPLRAKLLTFSALHYKLAPNDKGWAVIKSHEFNELLSELFQVHETFMDLEFKLYGTARSLEEPDESVRAANAILHAMKPLYTTEQQISSSARGRTLREPVASNSIVPNFADLNQGDDEHTCQFLMAPAPPRVGLLTPPNDDPTCQLLPSDDPTFIVQPEPQPEAQIDRYAHPFIPPVINKKSLPDP